MRLSHCSGCLSDQSDVATCVEHAAKHSHWLSFFPCAFRGGGTSVGHFFRMARFHHCRARARRLAAQARRGRARAHPGRDARIAAGPGRRRAAGRPRARRGRRLVAPRAPGLDGLPARLGRVPAHLRRRRRPGRLLPSHAGAAPRTLPATARLGSMRGGRRRVRRGCEGRPASVRTGPTVRGGCRQLAAMAPVAVHRCPCAQTGWPRWKEACASGIALKSARVRRWLRRCRARATRPRRAAAAPATSGAAA